MSYPWLRDNDNKLTELVQQRLRVADVLDSNLNVVGHDHSTDRAPLLHGRQNEYSIRAEHVMTGQLVSLMRMQRRNSRIRHSYLSSQRRGYLRPLVSQPLSHHYLFGEPVLILCPDHEAWENRTKVQYQADMRVRISKRERWPNKSTHRRTKRTTERSIRHL